MNKEVNERLKGIISAAIKKNIKKLSSDLTEIPPVILTTPKNPEHGHVSTNIALQLSRFLQKNPRQIASMIIEEIEKDKEEFIDNVVVAGPGFINFYLAKNLLHDVLGEIVRENEKYGYSMIGKKKKINIEFVSVNPTGPLHVGHGKCAAVGDSLAKILKAAGYQVTTEYYINDHGKQMDILAASVLARYLNLIGEEAEFPENGYKGQYIIDLAKEIIKEYKDKFKKNYDNQETLEFFKKYAHKKILQDIKNDLSDFGVNFDLWFSEESLYKDNKVKSVIDRLLKEDYVYYQDGALWLKASEFGDEKDRVVIRDNGEPTYFASDIAYHDDKYKRGFETLIDIWGADHHGYIKRMKAAVKALGHNSDSFQVLLVQFVTLVKEGKAIGMSTRGGEFVTLKDLLKEVGRDVARYFFLMHSYDSHTVFDLDIAKSESMENPVFYIQYAYARICSIIEKAKSANIVIDFKGNQKYNLDLLKQKEELELIRKLAHFRKVIERSALNWKPYLIANYLHDLAAAFHKYYTEYKVITDNKNLTLARLYLLHAIKIVLENALNLLGIVAPNRM